MTANLAGGVHDVVKSGAAGTPPNLLAPAGPLEKAKRLYSECMGMARRSVEVAYECGLALIEAKAQCRHGDFAGELEAAGIPVRTGQRLMRLARSVECDKLSHFESVSEALSSFGEGRYEHCKANNEWYTPSAIVEAARQAMGAIELDPASCAQANRTVRADRYLSQGGELADWGCKRVFLNPPYQRGVVEAFCARFAEHTGAICMVVNVFSDARHGQMAIASADAACFHSGRVRFVSPTGQAQGSQLGTMILYRGGEVSQFAQAFAPLGVTRRLARSETE